MSQITLEQLKQTIRTVPDFPKPGIKFWDITPVLGHAASLAALVEHLAGSHRPGDVDQVVGIDARGFILGAAVACHLQTGFVPIRKKGKLPFATIEQSYDLEYGSNTVAMHRDALQPGQRVLLVDDLLATGGTAAAAIELIRRLDARIIETVFFVELAFLKGRAKLSDVPVRSLVSF